MPILKALRPTLKNVLAQAIRNTRRGGFSPQSLFPASEQSAHYEPETPATLVQRRNLLTWSEDFTNAAWTTVNANVLSDELRPTVGAGYAQSSISTGTPGELLTVSFEYLSTGLDYISAYLGTFGSNRSGVHINTTTHVFAGDYISGTGLAPTNKSITLLGDGWRRVVFSALMQYPADTLIFRYLIGSIANGVLGVRLRKIQYEFGSVDTTYQKVTDWNTEYLAAAGSNITMFQESTGITPVTAVEQPVGLILDRRLGLVRGSELAVNGDFSGGATGWTLDTGYSITGDQLVASGVTLGVSAVNTGVVVAGTWYLVTANIVCTVGSFSINVGGTGAAYGVGTYAFSYYVLAASAAITIQQRGGSFTGTVDNLSVKAVPGNHATQSATGNKPTLSARVNLATKTEQFDDAAWPKTNITVTANAIAAPDGTMTADLLQATATGGTLINSGLFTATATTVTCSLYTKKGTLTSRIFLLRNNTTATNFDGGIFNYDTGLISGTGWTVETLANGWFRLKFTQSTGIAVSDTLIVYPGATGASTNAGDNWYMWGAQLESGSTATTYQRVNTASDYDTVGFLHYLKFDNFDDTISVPGQTGMGKLDLYNVTGVLATTYPLTLTSINQTFSRVNYQPVLQGTWYEPESPATLVQRRNVLTYSEQFDNAAWTKADLTLTANAAVAPDGTTSADLVYPTTTGTFRYFTRTLNNTVVSGQSLTNSIALKSSGKQWVAVTAPGSGGNGGGFFDLQNGTIGSVLGGVTAAIQSLGNGWYRCSVTQLASTTAMYCGITLTDADGSITATTSGTDGVLVWGAQAEVGTTATTYQKVTDWNTEYLAAAGSAVTMFQESTGATPVTAVEQPVGLLLDKRLGLVRGSETVTNGDFTSDSGWTKSSASVTWADGKYTIPDPSGTDNYIYQATTGTVSGKTYEVIVTIASSSVLMNLADFRLAYAAGYSTVPYISKYFPASGGVLRGIITAPSNNFTITAHTSLLNLSVVVESISVREVPGNHATQSTGGNKPTLSARVNLLTKSEQFDDAVWTNAAATVVANTATDPLGTTTADLIYPATTGTFRDKAQGPATTAGVSVTLSVYAKAAGKDWVYFRNLAGAALGAHFNVSTGSVGTVQAGLTATITSVGNGWYRCTMSGTSAGVVTQFNVGSADADNTSTSTTSGTNGVYVWGAQFEYAPTATTYQRVNTSTDYDTVGFKHYLKFDGFDDRIGTSSTVNLTGTSQLSGFYGFKYAGTGTYGSVFGNGSANGPGTAGGFGFNAPASSSITCRADLGGVSNIINHSFATAPGVPYCVSQLMDSVATPRQVVRLNGVQSGSSNTDVGSQPFDNAVIGTGDPAYTGGTTYYNGNIYCIILRGAACTTAQITSTETYVNIKTGAY